METTPLSTALTTFLSDPANAKAMMKTLVAAACNSSADNAGATALGGNYVHLLVDKSTGDIKFRSEADDAAVASGVGDIIVPGTFSNGDTYLIPKSNAKAVLLVYAVNVGSALVISGYSTAEVIYGNDAMPNTVEITARSQPSETIILTFKKDVAANRIRYKWLYC